MRTGFVIEVNAPSRPPWRRGVGIHARQARRDTVSRAGQRSMIAPASTL
jgi:hypothetical protein